MRAWSPEEASTIYWLVFWGYSNKEVLELAKDVLSNRSPDGIQGYTTDARKYVSELRGFNVFPKASPRAKELFKRGSKISPVKEIETMRPEDLSKVEFKAAMTHIVKPGKKVANPIKYEQVDSNPKRSIEEKLAQIKSLEIPRDSPNTILGDPIAEKDKVICGKDLVDAPIPIGKEFAINVAFQEKPKEPTLEEVLKAAKIAGATKVCYKDYVIKFV